MILTLNLTENCNMDCEYCIHNKVSRDMTEDVVYAACEMIFKEGKTAGLSFFGGEPLLKKDLIKKALERCSEISKITGKPFASRMTTNGVLLDDEFISLASKYKVMVDISFDGLAQNLCRHMKDGSDSLSIVECNAKKLLKVRPNAYAMMTIAPKAVSSFYESVKYLYELGFRYITATIAYGKRVSWTDEDIEELEKQYMFIADYYIDKCVKEKDPFFFSPFDGKTGDLISGKNPAERCHLGKRQMPVATNGNIYPCTQFVGDDNYYMGNVFDGMDEEAWKKVLLSNSKRTEPDECITCEFRKRCTHTCGCSNRMETGDEALCSPLQCTYEKLIIRISDMVADKIMEADMEAFSKKYKIKID